MNFVSKSGVTILLAFFVNSLVISNYTPEGASDLPVIGNCSKNCKIK